ncbi:hypothetical protein L208DRAFT_1380902 [Tricholoma matsutake]|nr:hypothetical protein L208DRAFT_1380902 [Tricholoma matsutake 945]
MADNIDTELQKDIKDILAEKPACKKKMVSLNTKLEAKQQKEKAQREKQKAARKVAKQGKTVPKKTSKAQDHDSNHDDSNELDIIDDISDADTMTIQPNASIGSINQLKLFWKQNVPADDKQKPLANASGFCAMTTKLNELLAKNKDTTITLTLPPLLQVALQPGDTAGHGLDAKMEEFAQGPNS